MRQFRNLALVLVLGFIAFQPMRAQAADSPNLAIELDLRGGFVGFDQSSYDTARAIMGSLVASGMLQHWVTTSRGLEGGGTYCMQFYPEFVSKKASALAQFQKLNVDTSTTVFSVRELGHCEIPQ